MVIGFVQMDIIWGDSSENQHNAERFIENNLSEASVVVLPEMFATGFSMRPTRIAEPIGSSSTLRWLQTTAIKYNKAIVCSVAIEDGGDYFNRLFFVFDDGTYDFYDKHHLFRMAGENKVYSQGDIRKIICYKGVRFLPLVCYDLRFPVWSRNIENDYDVIIYVASWPADRDYAWEALLKARAIENQAYVIGVNRVGNDKANCYCGNSLILDYLGSPIASLERNKEGVAMADISVELLNSYRESFPAYLDSDNFMIVKSKKEVKLF